MKNYFKTTRIWVLGLLGIFASLSAGASPFVSLTDSQAGQGNSVLVTGLLAEETIDFTLTQPEGTKVAFSSQTDSEGVLRASIFSLHLQQAGNYQLEVAREFEITPALSQDFQVFPGAASAYASTWDIESSSVAADGSSEAHFTLTLKDAYHNLVPNQAVTVVSSRSDDIILTSGMADSAGVVRGRLRSQTPGVSVLSAVTDSVAIFDKTEVLFHLPANDLGAVGASDNLGKFLKAQLFEEAFETVAYFLVEDLPAPVDANKNYSVKVTAKDQNGDTVKDYTGMVRFSSSDNQAQLPADYEFTESDQGEKEFALALTFATPGKQTLLINDLANFNIKGEASTDVYGENTSPNLPAQSLSIITPLEGSYSASRMTITGKGTPGQVIKILDGPTLLISDLTLDSNGDFVYQTPALADGRHKFTVVAMDETEASNTVSVLIDQTPPRVLAAKADPGVVEIEEIFSVEVSSNEPLSGAICAFNNVSQDMVKSEAGFRVNFQAPATCGSYPVDCRVSDLMGNELVQEKAATIQVCADGESEPIEIPLPVEPEPAQLVAPTGVMNLSASAGYEKVTLFWSPAKDDQGVSHYKIAFGTDPNQLTGTNYTPDDRTQWYIEGLKESTKYYFRVLAIDGDDLEGPFSSLVEATTEGEVLHPAAVPESGNQYFWPIMIALASVFGFWVLGFRRV